MPANIEIPLDLPEVRIITSELNEREIVIRVESTREWAICHKCGGEIREFHSYGQLLRLRHLPILGRPVIIEIRPRRFRCPSCDDHPTTTQRLDWYDERSPHTKAYDQWLLLSLIGSTISDVARKEGVSYDEMLGALERKIAGTVNWAEIKRLEILGLDEIALKKGHRDFVALATTRQADGRIKLLGVLPDRRLETVKEFLRSIPEELRATIREVCTDMYEGYTNAVKEVLPQAKIVVDRFHVAEAYRDCADQLRKQVQRELKAELSEEEYEGLKGTMWLFRRDPQELSKEDRKRLALLFECAPDLKRAYELREQLTAIFDRAHTKASATAAIKRWMERVHDSGLRCFDRFLVTLENWFDEITNYFVSRLTSGFVEGFNNKVKVLKRRCYGITNITHLFQRLYLDLEGYRLFGL
ncbi:MAG: ISL3 family transposase [Acidobacteria bacterium]|nr:ISL3 family transposase [Acidobacteriota bacterium]